jgi:putative transposase
MPYYRRAHIPGGTFFFTLVTENRAPILCDDLARTVLHSAIADCAQLRPFVVNAIVLMPDHLHMLVTLPEDDADFSTRLAFVKARFTHDFLACGGTEQLRSASRLAKRRRGVWQRWFWEHAIRDTADLNNHLDYIHFNPVKHGLASCPHAWPYSSFSRHVRQNSYDSDWQCTCDGQTCRPPELGTLNTHKMECGE